MGVNPPELLKIVHDLFVELFDRRVINISNFLTLQLLRGLIMVSNYHEGLSDLRRLGDRSLMDRQYRWGMHLIRKIKWSFGLPILDVQK